MSWLVEDPWTIVILGAVGEVLLLVALVRTRRGLFLACMGGVLALTGLGVLVERLVVTPREEVEGTLYAAAEAVRGGDIQRVLEFVAPEADDVRTKARFYLALIEFHKIAIRAPETHVSDRIKNTARVRFTAHVQGGFKSGAESGTSEGPVYLEVQFRKEGDRWLVTGYEQLSLVPGQQEPLPRERG